MWIFVRQSLYFGVACVCVNAFHTGLLSTDQAVECVHKIQNMAGKQLEVSSIFHEHHLFARPNKLTLAIDQWIIFGETFSISRISEDFLTAWAVVGAPLQSVISFWGSDENKTIFFSIRLVAFPYLLACFFMDLCCVAMEELCRWRNNMAVSGEIYLKIR